MSAKFQAGNSTAFIYRPLSDRWLVVLKCCGNRWRFVPVFVFIWSFLLMLVGGCATVPPASKPQANTAQSDGNYEYDGWLFKSLTGKNKPTANNNTSTPKPSGQAVPSVPGIPGGTSVEQASTVQQASAVDASMVPGPLVPGPSSHGRSVSTGMESNSLAGPPPTIPSELPTPPADAVSILNDGEKQEKKGFELSDLAPENIYKNFKKAVGRGPNERVARAAMEEGKALFREKKYKEAAAKFAVVIDRWPDTPLEEDAMFLKGESEFFADEYKKAHDTYGGLLKKYTNTRYLDTVVRREFAIGRYWEQLYDAKPTWPIVPNFTDPSKPMFDTFGYAVQAYERVRLNDPTGPIADDALMALGNAYFRRGQYENAAYNYDLLRKEYPNSEHQLMAHQLGLQAKMRMYQGTLYSPVPLKEAETIADQTLRQYGDKLGENREKVAVARVQITEELANRDYIMAEYYEKKGYYGAAKLYYQSVVDNYPHTERAKESLAKLEHIRHEPDEPPSRMAWLTEMFSSEKKLR